jgi:hypothetical protein
LAPWLSQKHRDLDVLDPSCAAGVSALHADRMDALLDIASLINDQDRARLTEMIDDVAPQIITDGVGVPHRPGQQMLQPVRAHIAAMLGDRPTVLTIQARHQPEHQPGGTTPGFIPFEPRRNAIQQLGEAPPPPVRVYAMRRGHRG